MPVTQRLFRPALFRYLQDLAENNRREWFHEHRERYEAEVRMPALEFIAACARPLQSLSPYFEADPRPVGGSLFRIQRDVRFTEDKSPYKTYVGIQFRHERGRDVHSPGFYLHLEPGRIYCGVGLWRPSTHTARRVREALVEEPEEWKRATGARKFREAFDWEGRSLKRAPVGFDPEHPLIEDLRRKDFVATAALRKSEVTGAGFPEGFVALCRRSRPFMAFLCRSLGLEF